MVISTCRQSLVRLPNIISASGSSYSTLRRHLRNTRRMSTFAETDVKHNEASHFLYFAFGSNLLAERLRLSCPSAQRLCAGRLQGYKLTFNYNSLRWRGHVATIRESEHDSIWGCVWTISKEELEALHRQEGVHQGLYRPLNVDVCTSEGITLQVLTYQMTLPYEDSARPSVVYKRVMLLGAEQSSLPSEYINHMRSLPDNGYDGQVDVDCNLAYRQDTKAPQFHVEIPESVVEQIQHERDLEPSPQNAAELTAKN